jgi:hypothetical protein
MVSAPGQCHDTENELSWVSGNDLQQVINELNGRVSALEQALGVINTAPTVSAGDDQTILISMYAFLVGTATDDGLIVPLTYLWERKLGPGNVSFDDRSSLTTNASFDQPGNYVLKLTAYDGSVEVSDEVNIIVYPDNDPPIITSGSPQIVYTTPEINTTYQGTSYLRCRDISLDVTVTDDGPLPLTYWWTIDNKYIYPNYSPYTNYNTVSVTFSDDPQDSVLWPLNIVSYTTNSNSPYNQHQYLARRVYAELTLSVSDGWHTVTEPFTVVCSWY